VVADRQLVEAGRSEKGEYAKTEQARRPEGKWMIDPLPHPGGA
jgi:hypothetical protein